MKAMVGRTIALAVILIVGVAAIYLVASNGGNKVVPPVVEETKAASEGQTVSNPEPTGPQPRIQFEETVYNWGTVYQSEKVPHIFKFKNIGKSDLIIEKVKSS